MPAGPLRVEATPPPASPGVAVVLTPERPPPLPAVPASWELTAREHRVVALLLSGASNRQLAEALCVSDNTVETHLRHIYEKLGVRGRQQVLARYFRETARAALRGEPGGPREEHRA
jgi:DNA-binding CsgD family transcriptional regulator